MTRFSNGSARHDFIVVPSQDCTHDPTGKQVFDEWTNKPESEQTDGCMDGWMNG